MVYEEVVLDMAKAEPRAPDRDSARGPGARARTSSIWAARSSGPRRTTWCRMIEGRSSIGRLGLFVHVTAGFGDVGFCGYWTLEMFAVQPMRIYPGVPICQIFYHEITGDDHRVRQRQVPAQPRHPAEPAVQRAEPRRGGRSAVEAVWRRASGVGPRWRRSNSGALATPSMPEYAVRIRRIPPNSEGRQAVRSVRGAAWAESAGRRLPLPPAFSSIVGVPHGFLPAVGPKGQTSPWRRESFVLPTGLRWNHAICKCGDRAVDSGASFLASLAPAAPSWAQGPVLSEDESSEPTPPAANEANEPAGPAGYALLQAAHKLTLEPADKIDYDQVITMCEEGLSAQLPDDQEQYGQNLLAWALNRRGEAKAVKGDETAAFADFQKAISLKPDAWRALHNRAVNFAVAGKSEEAMDDFNKTIELNPNYANAYFNRGELHYDQGRYAHAITDYNKALQLTANDSSAYNSRGHAYYQLGRYRNALTDYSRALRADPRNAAASTTGLTPIPTWATSAARRPTTARRSASILSWPAPTWAPPG